MSDIPMDDQLPGDEGPADAGAGQGVPGEHDGGADGGAGGGDEGPADTGAGQGVPGEHDGGADGGRAAPEGPADSGAGDPGTSGEHDGGADGGAGLLVVTARPDTGTAADVQVPVEAASPVGAPGAA